jgi:hypothetical protein
MIDAWKIKAQERGGWRTLRNPRASHEVYDALALFTYTAAEHARAGRSTDAANLKRAIDTLRDFVTYEPLDETSLDAVELAP